MSIGDVMATTNNAKSAILISLVLLLLIFAKANAALTVTLTPSNVVTDSGQTQVLTASWSAGTAPYTVNYFNVTGNQLLKSYTGIATTSNTFTFSVNTLPGSFDSWANMTPTPQSV